MNQGAQLPVQSLRSLVKSLDGYTPSRAHCGARLRYRGARGGMRNLDMESGAQRGVSIVDIVGMSMPHGVILR